MGKNTVGQVVIDIKADTQKLVSGFNRAESAVSKSTRQMKNAILGVTTAYLSLQGVNAFGGMIKGSIDAADNIGKLADKLAINSNSLSKLEYAAGFADVSLNQLNASMSAMIRRSSNFKKDGTGAAAKAMNELGITTEFAKKNFTSTEATFKILLDRLSQMPSSMKRTAIAQDLFSKSAADVIRLADMGAKQIKALGDEGERLGIVFSSDFIKQAGDLNDQFDKVGKTFDGVANKIAMQFTPALLDATNQILKNKEVVGTLGSVASSSIIGILTAVQMLTLSVTGGMYVFDTLATYIAQIGNNGELAFKLIIAAWDEMMLEIQKKVQSVAPDFVGNALGIDKNSIKKATRTLLESEHAVTEVQLRIQKRLIDHYDYSENLNKTNVALKKFIETYKEYNNVDNQNKNGTDAIVVGKGEISTNAKTKPIDYKIADWEGALYLAQQEAKKKLDDKLKKESELTFDVKINVDDSSLNRTTKALFSMSSNVTSMNKEQKAWNKYYDKYSKKIQFTQKDTKEFKEFEAKHTANQIAGYANLAGAISGVFTQGSSEAEAFIKVQQGLAMVNAVNAVLTQGAGDPYTAFARMATMAATVATFLSDAGVSGGVGAVNQKDYTSTIDGANYGSNTLSASGVNINNYDNHFDKFIDGLDKASARLEDFGSDGSSNANKLNSLTNSINSLSENNSNILNDLSNLNISSTYSQGETNDHFNSRASFYGKDFWRSSHDNNEDSAVRTDVTAYANELIANNNNTANTIRAELTTLLTENVSSNLDYSLLDQSQLQNLISDFDQDAYNQTLQQINNLAIIAKQNGGVLSAREEEQLINLYTLPNFVKGQDYEGAIARVKELSDAVKDASISFVSSIRDITVSIDDMINNTLNATSSIGAVGLSGNAATEYYLKEYNKLQDEFNSFTSDGVLDVSHLDDAKDVYSRLLNTTKSITSSNALSGDALSSMVTSINNSLGKNTDVLYNTNDVLKVNIVATESEDFKNLLSLNATQLATFTGAFTDGVLSKGEVSNLNLTSTQIDLISSAYSGVSNTNMTIEEYLQSLNKPTAFALGGIVTAPTNALIGEAGYSEAVIPLNNTNIMENLEGKGISQVVARLDTLTDITIQQANEIVTLRKEVEDNQGVA